MRGVNSYKFVFKSLFFFSGTYFIKSLIRSIYVKSACVFMCFSFFIYFLTNLKFFIFFFCFNTTSGYLVDFCQIIIRPFITSLMLTLLLFSLSVSLITRLCSVRFTLIVWISPLSTSSFGVVTLSCL